MKENLSYEEVLAKNLMSIIELELFSSAEEMANITAEPAIVKVGDAAGYVIQVGEEKGKVLWLAGVAKWTRNIFESLHFDDDNLDLAFKLVEIMKKKGLNADLPIEVVFN
ncbi:MAG: hypothetical protein Q8Q23_06545 [bacterium]|nr:hypothetical protein [bacterium]